MSDKNNQVIGQEQEQVQVQVQANADFALQPTESPAQYSITAKDTAPVYTSLDVSGIQGKRKLYKITNHPDHTISEFINKPIRAVDIYVDANQRMNKDPESENFGVYENKPRTIIIDENGESYVAGVSIGIFNAVKEIIRIFGEPHTWDEPLTVIPVTVRTPKGNMLSLEVE